MSFTGTEPSCRADGRVNQVGLMNPGYKGSEHSGRGVICFENMNPRVWLIKIMVMIEFLSLLISLEAVVRSLCSCSSRSRNLQLFFVVTWSLGRDKIMINFIDEYFLFKIFILNLTFFYRVRVSDPAFGQIWIQGFVHRTKFFFVLIKEYFR